MLIDIHEASRDLIEARERLGPAVYYRLDLWERLKELALPADTTPKPPAGGDAIPAGEVEAFRRGAEAMQRKLSDALRDHLNSRAAAIANAVAIPEYQA